MHDRIVLIIEASQEAAAATARLFGRLGAMVVVHYRQDRRGARCVQQSINAAGGSAILIQADITILEEVLAMAVKLQTLVGRVDTIVLFPAAHQILGSTSDWPFAAYERVVASETAAAKHVCRALVPAMQEAARGWIVAVHDAPHRTVPNREAIRTLVRSIRDEFGFGGIIVGIVTPECETRGEASDELGVSLGTYEPARSKDVASSVVAFCRQDETEGVSYADPPSGQERYSHVGRD